MKLDKVLDLYSDYIISGFGLTTATGLSELLDGEVSHDRVRRLLSGEKATSKMLWQVVKPHVRELEKQAELKGEEAVLIIDDSIAHKPYTDENEIICWHYDHSEQRTVKGINFLTCLYHCCGVSLPIGFELVAKTEYYLDKDGKEKRRSPRSKNQSYRDKLRQARQNHVKFKYVSNDIWFASAENMNFVKKELQKEFVMPIKTNRKVALSPSDKQSKRYHKVDTLSLETMEPVMIYLEDVDYPLLLIKQVFANGDGSTGILYLVTSDTTLSGDAIATLYQKRWNVELYHKSLKQNASLEKSPTKTVTTQTNHFFASLCGYVKLELLKKSTGLNHFALRSKLYLKAIRSAFDTLQQLKPISLAA
jgi:hypothetical protein